MLWLKREISNELISVNSTKVQQISNLSTNYDVMTNTHMVQFDNITEDDRGTYQCVIAAFTNITQEVKVHVKLSGL